MKTATRSKQLTVLVFLTLLFLTPIAHALEISNVQTTDITQNSASITYQTDEPANTIISYGTDAAQLKTIGDAPKVTTHKLILPDLTANTNYIYKVQSEEVTNDNQGALYTFQTLAPDTTPPTITADIQATLTATQLSFTGTTEAHTQVILKLNNKYVQETNTKDTTTFEFNNIILLQDVQNNITLTAKDAANNEASITAIVTADIAAPRIILAEFPEFVSDHKVTLKGNLTEPAKIQIEINDRKLQDVDLTNTPTTLNQFIPFSVDLQLQENMNNITLTAVDAANHSTTKEIKILSDTQPPQVRIDISRGKEYYEGRATSTIDGHTDPLATLYLYIYTPQPAEYYPDFKRARAKTTADENGDFTFKDVSFSGPGFRDATLEDFTPKELPSALVQEPIYPFQTGTNAESKPYYIYIIAEDKGGHTGYGKETVQVNSCYSPNFDFSIESMPEFQAPLKLMPQLLDDGRQDIQATFKFTYLGQGMPSNNPNGGLEDRGIRITQMDIEPACTDGMAKDDKYSIGCKIFPRSQPNPKIPNVDKTIWYTGWKLLPAADFLEREDSTWDDFKKRQVIFPIKVKLRYSEKTAENSWSEAKEQYFCTDIGYFVDIPLESKEYMPDFLAHDAVNALNWTIDKLHTATPYVEQAYLISGYSCMGSFLLKTTARFGRIFTTKLEVIYGVFKGSASKAERDAKNIDVAKCPTTQDELYREDELENYLKIKQNNNDAWNQFLASFPNTAKGKSRKAALELALQSPHGKDWEIISLDKRCPKTATAWTIESALDKAYKWSCDRAFCRTVPAGWTSDVDLGAIDKVIQSQKECAVTGRGVPLVKKENCKELIKSNVVASYESIGDSGTCWQTADGSLYVNDQTDDAVEKIEKSGSLKSTIQDNIEDPNSAGVYYLRFVGKPLEDFVAKKPNLLVYKPAGSDTPIVGRDKTCQQVCGGNSRVQGFGADVKDSPPHGCWDEVKDDLGKTIFQKPGTTEKLGDKTAGDANQPKKYPAGYTSDCFIKSNTFVGPLQEGQTSRPEDVVTNENGEPILQQCVCVGASPEQSEYSARTAIKEYSNVKEEWFYHQEQVFREDKSSGVGTYYPKQRYYTGRDVSGAFGADYLFDYIHTTDETKTEPVVSPHASIVGTVQTMCLSGILKNMKMLEAMLTGIRNCLVEAKYTGLQDAGMCKTLFTQQVCGLLYKAIASATSGCTPSTFEDLAKETIFGDVGTIIKAGTEGMGEAVSTSINDIQEDYGNAKLNEYFKGGTQGFAQSICLAAFGYDIPLFDDSFLLDAAYSFPVHSAVLVMPANRELSSYNPAKQTAVYNYQVGATVLPGCKMSHWSVKLKCIGPEDATGQGIDESCDGQGCDCKNIEGASPYDNQRTMMLAQDNAAQSGSVLNIPIETPVRSEGPFRYDHVVVELTLDGSEKGNEDACFDKEYLNGNKATYYYPISDHSPKVLAGCSPHIATGRFTCPQLSNLLGFGAAYIEAPDVSCWNEKTQSRMDCNTPNLYTINDRIKVGAHLYLDGKTYCLKRTITGVPGIARDEPPKLIPSAITGPYIMEYDLGAITAAYFGGAENNIRRSESSNPACSSNLNRPGEVPTDVHPGQYVFNYEKGPDGNIVVSRQGTLITVPVGYDFDNAGHLIKGTQNTWTKDELNRIEFTVDGFKVSNIFGDISVDPASTGSKQCVLQVTSGAAAIQESGQKNIGVRFDLLNADDQGSCTYAKDPVKTGGVGKQSVQTNILIQKERSITSSLHQNFMSGNFNELRSAATTIITQEKGDSQNAQAIYYYIGSLVMERGPGTEESTHNRAIQNLLAQFFDRKFQGRTITPYDPSTVASDDFQHIAAYLCQIDKSLNGPYTKVTPDKPMHEYCVGKLLP